MVTFATIILRISSPGHSKYGNLLLKTTYHLIGIVSMAAFVEDDVPFDRHISMATFC